jgi:hypothetical protein
MKRTAFQFLALTTLAVMLAGTLEARQSEVPPAPIRPRGAGQGQGGAGKAPKQAQQLPRNLAPDQPTQPPIRANNNAQIQRNRVENAVVDRYLGGFQKNVDLDDEQTQKLSRKLGAYVRQQLNLAERRNQALMRLKELNDQKASEEEIQTQNRTLEEIEAQQVNAKKRFYNEVNPDLSVQQQAKLRVYMDNTDQNVRQAIQKSRNDQAPPPPKR